MNFWASLENWSWDELTEAIGTLGDKYSFLLPHYDFVASVQPCHLVGAAKYARPSAPGLDGWTHMELALLPEQAWFDPVRACVSTPESMLGACYSPSKCITSLDPWNSAQHALSGGAVTACAKIALAKERAALGLYVLWGLSVDFAKMFNTLSPHVAAAVARITGWSMHNIRDLTLPILKAKGVWRLPGNCPTGDL